MRAQLKPPLTAILAGAAAGAIALLTYQAMLFLQHVIWNTGVDGEVGPIRIIVTILLGGAILILLARIAPSESMDELLRDSKHPVGRSPKKILVTALVAIVSIAFGGAIGPEAGLLAVVAQCSIIVSRYIARDEAQAREIAQAGAAGVLGGLYGSPPAAATIDTSAPAPTKAMSFLAGLSGFATFILLARTVFGGEGVAAISLPNPSDGSPWLVIVPALVGACFGLAFRVLHHATERAARRITKPWVVTAVGTALFAVLAAWIPLVRFSGHHELHDVTELFNAGAGGQLWLVAAVKIVAVVLCLVAGWRGGEVFPLIFIGAAAGAATALLLPEVDPASAMAAAMAATLAIGWRRPLPGVLVLLLVIDAPVVIPLLLGTGIGVVIDQLMVGRGDQDPARPMAPAIDAPQDLKPRER